MELLPFACPACGQPLRYDFEQVGHPFQCPRCGASGTLPEPGLLPDEPTRRAAEEDLDEGPSAGKFELVGGLTVPPPDMPVQHEQYHEEVQKLRHKDRRSRAWRPLHRGLTVLLGTWLIVTALATLLLLGVEFNCLKVLFQFQGSSPGKAGVGVLGLLLVVTECAGLYGYRLCMGAPPGQGIRDWAAVAFGLAAVRNLGCLTTSILYLALGGGASRALTIATIVAAGLFFGQWFVALLLLRAVADAHQSYALMRMAWNGICLLVAVVLGWVLLLCVYFAMAGGEEQMAKLGVVEGGWLRLLVGCGGTVLAAGLWLAFVWHLRLLNSMRGVFET